jgi:hypothetical protein
MKNTNYILNTFLVCFFLLACNNNNHNNQNRLRNEDNTIYDNSSRSNSNNIDCNDLKEEALSYLKVNWGEIKGIIEREAERSENEETKNEVTIDRIADLASGSIIASKLDKLQKQMEYSCPDVYQEYSQAAAIFMLSNLDY